MARQKLYIVYGTAKEITGKAKNPTAVLNKGTKEQNHMGIYHYLHFFPEIPLFQFVLKP